MPSLFFDELVSRNRGLIDPRVRSASARDARDRRLRLHGGSLRGPTRPFRARPRFVLVDPGTYELANLNRQDGTIDDVGRNKAEVQGVRIRACESPCGRRRRPGRALAGERRIPAGRGRHR